MIHVSLPAEVVFHSPWFPITNTLVVTWLLMLLFLIFSFLATRKLQEAPSGLQNFTELIFESLENLFAGMVGERARMFFPLVVTFFLFIILGNWSGLLPGFGSIGFWEVKDHEKILLPLFRRATADLNTTLALALFSVGAIQYFGLRQVKIAYLRKFFNFQSPIYFFVGILEIISEVAKIISFSFRLFGNMFAGEVLIIAIGFLIPLVVPIPFLFLELFIGFVQAFIFSMLTLVFLNTAVSFHEH